MEALAFAGPILSLIGGATSAIGGMQQASAMQSAALYQAQVARNNAITERQNAAWETQIGETQATAEGMKTRAIVGAEKSAEAASGIDVNTGSAVDVRSSAADLGELNALTIRSNAARRAYGYETGAVAQEAQAALDTQQASQAMKAGEIGAISSLLGGASAAGSKYAQWSLINPGGGGGAVDPLTGLALS